MYLCDVGLRDGGGGVLRGPPGGLAAAAGMTRGRVRFLTHLASTIGRQPSPDRHSLYHELIATSAQTPRDTVHTRNRDANRKETVSPPSYW